MKACKKEQIWLHVTLNDVNFDENAIKSKNLHLALRLLITEKMLGGSLSR